MEMLSRLKTIQERDRLVRAIFVKHLGIDQSEDNPGYKAWAIYASEVGVQLINILTAARHPNSGRTLTAMMDLTYQLNANDFWSKNTQVLVPLLMAALNGIRDAGEMLEQRSHLSEYALNDEMISASKLVGLDIFPVMLLLAGGPALMATHSLPLKLDLAPFLGT